MVGMHRWLSVLLAGVVAAAGCSRAPEARSYQLQGQILAVKPETNEILVKHDNIAGFMPAMTMPYTVKDPALLKDRVPGDLITADPAVWRFATAPEEIVDRLAATFGVNVIRETDGTITHNLRTAVIDPRGRIVSIHDSNAWAASTIVDELKAAVLAR